MNFTDFENIMRAKGLATLADIARDLDTTPQAVSNWKSRDQVPYHIVALISRLEDNNFYTEEKITSKSSGNISHFSRNNNSEINIGDLLLTIAQQIKIIAFCFMVSVFISFTFHNVQNGDPSAQAFAETPRLEHEASFVTVLRQSLEL